MEPIDCCSLDYDFIVGGVFLISKEHYRLVNGFSNIYWGWGGEDDDMGKRFRFYYGYYRLSIHC